MKRIIIVIVFLTGCSTPKVWTHSSGDKSKWHQDYADCKNQLAVYRTRLNEEYAFKSLQEREYLKNCLNSKGYVQVSRK